MAQDKRAGIVKGLPGKDLSGVLAAPEGADINAVRDGALFNYNMFAYTSMTTFSARPSTTCKREANRTNSRLPALSPT